MENRMLNMACLMILLALFMFLVLNSIIGLWQRSILILFVFVCELLVYYFSRFKKKFHLALIINGLISYVALAFNYYINSGINGPTLFLFFFTLHLLISGTPNRLHLWWLLLHTITVLLVMAAEFSHPSLIKYTYRDNTARIVDEVSGYIVTLLLIFQVTRYLRNYYRDEKLNTEEYELKLKAFFDSSDDCHFLLNTACEVQYFNNTAFRFILDVHKKELKAGNNMRDYVNPAYATTFIQNCAEALKGKAVHEERMFTYQMGNIWWHISFMPVWDSAQNVIGLSFNSADITAVKEQEERLRLKNESLLKIAYIQTYELSQPVVSIINLMNLIKTDSQNMEKYLQLMEEATLKLDNKIYEIVAQTKGASAAE